MAYAVNSRNRPYFRCENPACQVVKKRDGAPVETPKKKGTDAKNEHTPARTAEPESRRSFFRL